MGTRYRVDRCEGIVPCGMNSIRYLGDSLRDAQRVFNALEPGVDAWDKPDARCGVTLAEWRGQHTSGDYVVIKSKGLI